MSRELKKLALFGIIHKKDRETSSTTKNNKS